MIIHSKELYFAKNADGIATLRTRVEERKSGKEWKINYFICSNKNSNRANCKNKQIRADYIEDEIKKQLEKEIKKITYSKEELRNIFKNSQIDAKKDIEELEENLKRNKRQLETTNNMLEEIYQDKVNKIIKLVDFEKFYNKKNSEKINIVNKIDDLRCEIEKRKEKLEKIDIDKILMAANTILDMQDMTKRIYEQLIDRIEFDSEKNIYIKFRFEKFIK